MRVLLTSTFVLLFVLSACEGKTGPQGPAGLTGAPGPTGAVGPVGPSGSMGNMGAMGDAGVQGIPGPVVVVQSSDGGFVTIDGGVAIVTGPRGESVVLHSEPAGANCVAGGVSVTQGGLTAWICNGTQGPQGDAGVQGIQGPQGDAGIQGLQGVQGPRRVLLDANNAVIGPMVGTNGVYLSALGCTAAILGTNTWYATEISYYTQANCAGTAYAYGVGDGCVLGTANLLLRRVTPMNPASLTVASYYNGTCVAVTGQYSLVALTPALGAPSLTGPFTIVTQ